MKNFHHDPNSGETGRETHLSLLPKSLKYIASLLPHQGPIEVFIHQNTLHSFENTPFWEALDKASTLFNAEAAMGEREARDAFRRGRIQSKDLLAVLPQEDAKTLVHRQITRENLRLALFHSSEPIERAASVLWMIEEHEASREWSQNATETNVRRIVRSTYRHLRKEMLSNPSLSPLFFIEQKSEESDRPRIREHLLRISRLRGWGRRSGFHSFSNEISLRILWASCLSKVFALPQAMLPKTPEAVRGATDRVNHYLIRLAESFLDQGIASWALPGREDGFWKAVVKHLREPSAARPNWLSRVTEVLNRLPADDSQHSIAKLLEFRGVALTEQKDTLLESALALRGWAGLFAELERHPNLLTGYPASVPCSLSDFLAVRLLLENTSASFSSAPRAMEERPAMSEEDLRCQLAYSLFLTAQSLGISGLEIDVLSPDPATPLFSELCRWGESERRNIWHRAFEHHLEEDVSRALVMHNEKSRSRESSEPPIAQVVCCLDDREESLRRYLEEEGVETFGAAGFFGVDIEFHPMSSHSAPFCPAQIIPTHHAFEVPKDCFKNRLKSWRFGGRVWHKSRAAMSESSMNSLSGVFVNSIFGSLASIPLVIRVLFPRTAFQVSRWIRETLFKRDDLSDLIFTDEELKRLDPLLNGFTVDEMASRVGGLFRTIGLSKRFAPYVIILGHGSFSRNNPMRSAYDCGACGGHPGVMNARIFARMANLPTVRDELARRGMHIPEETVIIGGCHNTCTDEVPLFLEDRAASLPTAEQEKLRGLFNRVRGKNALERTRRFPVSLKQGDYKKALSYVEWRSQHIGEPRPEFGHATNAFCFVGKRESTKNLFLDRRAFLVSYDQEADPKGDMLLGVLSAVVPVCSGINLEYFFSALDNTVYGAGSKLPQNITCLLGVMTGYESDLRTGLPKQMIDIHEPVRLIFVIEADESVFKSVLERNVGIRDTIQNEWVLMNLYDTKTNTIRRYKNGVFTTWTPPENLEPLPRAISSEAWVFGRKGYLPFAALLDKNTQSANNHGN